MLGWVVRARNFKFHLLRLGGISTTSLPLRSPGSLLQFISPLLRNFSNSAITPAHSHQTFLYKQRVRVSIDTPENTFLATNIDASPPSICRRAHRILASRPLRFTSQVRYARSALFVPLRIGNLRIRMLTNCSRDSASNNQSWRNSMEYLRENTQLVLARPR